MGNICKLYGCDVGCIHAQLLHDVGYIHAQLLHELAMPYVICFPSVFGVYVSQVESWVFYVDF